MSFAPRRPRWALALCLLICALPLWLAGCKRPDFTYAEYAEPAPPYDESDMAYGGGGGGYGGEYDEDYGGEYDEEYRVEEELVLEAPAPEPGPASRSRADRKASFKLEKNRRKAPEREITTTADTKVIPKPGPEALEVEAPEVEQPAPVSKKRQVIYTATMQVSVYDLDHALEVVEAMPARYGGWLQQRIDSQLVLRIPAEKLEAAMEAVAELGVVDYRLLEALDVTAEYTDLESRIRVLEQMQTHLKALLAKAKDVEQALEIRQALDQITLELEVARAQMRELAKSIAFSTLILNLVERGPGQDFPSSNDPFPWVDELGVEATDYR
jgi:hypothetical protein